MFLTMRIAYLDCFSGISGDMFLGALVDAGVPPRLFDDTVAALDIGARLEFSRVTRSGISAAKVNVHAKAEQETPPHHHQHQHGRTLSIIRAIIGKTAISDPAKAIAL